MNADSNNTHSLWESIPTFGAVDYVRDMGENDNTPDVVPLSLEQKISVECHGYLAMQASAEELKEQIYDYRNDHANEYEKLDNLNEEVRKAKTRLDQFKKDLHVNKSFDLRQMNNPAFADELQRKQSLAAAADKAKEKYQDCLKKRDQLAQKLSSRLDDMYGQLNSLLTGCMVQGVAIAKLANVPSDYTDRADWCDYIKFYIRSSHVNDRPVTAFHILYGGFDADGNPESDGDEHGHVSVDVDTGSMCYYRMPGESHGSENFGNYQDVSVRKLKSAIIQIMTKGESGENDNESALEQLQSKLQFLPAALRQLLAEGYELVKASPADSNYVAA